jgi:immune inhibitor A
VQAGQPRTIDLGPHEFHTAKPQGVVVVLPKKPVTTQHGTPAGGERQWWSGTGNRLDNAMTRQVTLPAGTAALTFQARWNIEDCGADPCDYAFVEVSTNGSTWTAIPGSITKAAEGNGIDGLQTAWTPATFDLSAYAGKTIGLRIRYLTDGGGEGQDAKLSAGILVDELRITGGDRTVLADGAETSPNGWTLKGFASVGVSTTVLNDNYYIASNRSYVSYDKYLRTGPYVRGYVDTRPKFAERFPYQEGLLIWYWDTSVADNNVSVHPGQGQILPIDAHPQPILNPQGMPWHGRIGLYDAPFTPREADSFTLHLNGKPGDVRGQAGQDVFDDSRPYWLAETPLTGVKVPNTGTRIEVQSHNGTSMRIRIS